MAILDGLGGSKDVQALPELHFHKCALTLLLRTGSLPFASFRC